MIIKFKKIKFQSYDPYATFSDPTNSSFVDASGKQIGLNGDNASALLLLGKVAYENLSVKSKKHFDDIEATYSRFSNKFFVPDDEAWENVFDRTRKEIKALANLTDGKPPLRTNSSEAFKADTLNQSQILNEAWWNRFNLPADNEGWLFTFKIMYSYRALMKLDSAITAMCQQKQEAAISASIAAANALAMVISIDTISETRTILASKKARAKDKNNQNDRSSVYQHWLNWQMGLENYLGKTDFARRMLPKEDSKRPTLKTEKTINHPSLKNRDTIKRWCLEWERGVVDITDIRSIFKTNKQ